MKYNRNLGAKKYSTVAEIYDSVDNDPKRPGFRIVYLDKASPNHANLAAWHNYLIKNGFRPEDITEKTPRLHGELYVALIIEASPETVTALKICF